MHARQAAAIWCSDTCSSGTSSAYVDMYNAMSNSWTRFPTGLGQARSNLAAASLPSGLVFFAGGLAGVRTGLCAFVSCDAVRLLMAVCNHACASGSGLMVL